MKKYVIVGTGGRGLDSYGRPLVENYKDCAELVAVCDINGKRAKYAGISPLTQTLTRCSRIISRMW